MWLIISKGLEDQGCCAAASLLVGTNAERMENCVLGHRAAAMGQ